MRKHLGDHPSVAHPRRRGLTSHPQCVVNAAGCVAVCPCRAGMRVIHQKKSRRTAAQELTGRRQTEWTGSTRIQKTGSRHSDTHWITNGKRPCRSSRGAAPAASQAFEAANALWLRPPSAKAVLALGVVVLGMPPALGSAGCMYVLPWSRYRSSTCDAEQAASREQASRRVGRCPCDLC